LTDEKVCEMKALYESGGDSATTVGGRKWETIVGYSPCEVMRSFKKGDRVRLTADYDLTKYIL
jgi:hypothetical protein